MQPLISESDRTLLTQHQVNIELDQEGKFGIIVLPNRRLKVSLLTKAVQEGSDWKAMALKTEQLKDTASKIAVMLLKKELIANQPPETRLSFKINHEGITRLTDNHLVKHEDAEEKKNTRADYDALTTYLSQTQAVPQEHVAAQTDELEQIEEQLNTLGKDKTTSAPLVEEIAQKEETRPPQELVKRKPRPLTTPQDFPRIPRHVFSQLPRWSPWDIFRTVGKLAFGLNLPNISSSKPNKPKLIEENKLDADTEQKVKIEEVTDEKQLRLGEGKATRSDIEDIPLDPMEPEQTMSHYLKKLREKQLANPGQSGSIVTRNSSIPSAQLGLKLLTGPTEKENPAPSKDKESSSQAKQVSDGMGEIQVEEMSSTMNPAKDSTLNMQDMDLTLHQLYTASQQKKKQTAKPVASQPSTLWNMFFGPKQNVTPESNPVTDTQTEPKISSTSKKVKKSSGPKFPKHSYFPDDDAHLLHSFMRKPVPQQKKVVNPPSVPKVTSAPNMPSAPKVSSKQTPSFFSAKNPYAFNSMNQFQ